VRRIHAYFEYQPCRSGKYPQEFLKGCKGYLHTDAYTSYKKVPDEMRTVTDESGSFTVSGFLGEYEIGCRGRKGSFILGKGNENTVAKISIV
jgi:Transposase IS66 family.